MCTADFVLRHHPLDRELEDPLGLALEQLPGGLVPLPARIARVPLVGLLLPLVAGEDDLVDVGHDDVVAGVDVGGVGRPVLPHQDRRDLSGQPADDLSEASITYQCFGSSPVLA